MTKREWLKCDDPLPMLEFVRGKLSERKLQLFACGCARSICHLLTETISRLALEIAEQVADGQGWFADKSMPIVNVRYAICKNAIEHAKSIPQGEQWSGWTNSEKSAYYAAITAAETISDTGSSDPMDWWASQGGWVATAASWALDYLFDAPHPKIGEPLQTESGKAESALQATFLRDLCGPLIFKRMKINREWFSPEVVKIAKAINDKRAYHRLSRLAEALETAGCKNREILDHCVEERLHIRGCWVVDLLLDKN